MKRKLFISQPMLGLTEEEILKQRAYIRFYAEDIMNEKFEVLETYFDDFNEAEIKDINVPLKYLAKSIDYMTKADVVVFGRGWDRSRGCKIEQQCAVEYGLICIYQ